ncbi:MAG TPA: hypothetical protein VGH29_05915 [Candidatus Binataceae bacterium]
MAGHAGSIGRCLMVGLMVGVLAGCSTVNSTSNLEPASPQNLLFYPGLVKGFEHTYPPRHILVLAVTDGCENATQVPTQDTGPGQLIGVTLDSRGQRIQRLYVSDLASDVQKAIEQAAQEAGMIASGSTAAQYAAQPVDADYVLQSRIVKCWVKKQRVVDNDKNPSWQTVAEFALEATIYKPPFAVPFWHGVSSETYSDPPDNPGLMPEDQASIYDEPGEVLSVAFTRSVEGLFKRGELHSLISEDRALHH